MTTNNNSARVTYSQLSTALDNGMTLAQITEMIEYLKDQKNLIEENIGTWQELIPELEQGEWGDRIRRRNLRIVVTHLFKYGYSIRRPVTGEDVDAVSWEVLKGDRVNSLVYAKGIGYTLNGINVKLQGMEPEPVN